MQQRAPVQRAKIGTTHRGILLRCDASLFDALHRRADQERKSLNLLVTEAVQRLLSENEQMKSPALTESNR